MNRDQLALLGRYWRTGRKVGRTLYAVVGDEPSDEDVLIGMMDTRALARSAVDSHNLRLAWAEDGLVPEGADG